MYKLLQIIGRQHSIPRGRERLVRAFADPDTIKSAPFVVEFFGNKYRGNLNSFIDWSMYFFGAYSRNELFLLQEAVANLQEAGRDVCFTNVGANVRPVVSVLGKIHRRIGSAFEPYKAD